MNICEECKQRQYPDNPEVAQFKDGKRYPPICEACPNYNPNPLPDLREIEKRLDALNVPAWTALQWDKIEQIQGELKHVHNKLNQIECRQKPQEKRSTYKGLKI